MHKLVAHIMRLNISERMLINHQSNLVVFEENRFLIFLSEITKHIDPE